MYVRLPSTLRLSTPGFGSVDLASLGIPDVHEYIRMYSERMRVDAGTDWAFYMAFVCFRYASILQGVYKRSTQGETLFRLSACERSCHVFL